MIIHDCSNVMCRTPLDTGECKKECIKRYKKMGIKTTYAEIEKKTLEQIYEDIKRFKNLVEVVRCKDCKYGNCTMKLLPGEVCCEFHDFTLVKEDDFCSHGERREGE